MRRRSFLIGASVAIAGATTWVLTRRAREISGPRKAEPTPQGYAERPDEPVLPERYRETLRAMVARLYPEGPDGPGAVTAKAYDYIEGELSRSNMQGIRRLLTNGAVQLDRVSMGQLKQAFASLGPADQDLVITAVQHGEGAPKSFDGAAFVEAAVIMTIEGMFCDPVYGGNAGEVGWQDVGYTMQSPRPVKV
ncbi:MAG: gluconate 2-dehydrogenase subunit 3 family protein [Clostridia bacterium]|nr:gluconate 2-dehydrogenase subunit 3 family protein [Deltaproteobacteria bacterium]